jgi:uncharacterized protein YkwD
MRLIAHLVTALALALTLSFLPGRAEALVPQAAQAAGTTDMKRTEYEQRVMYWINRARDSHSKRSVKVRPCVDRFAGRWARHLAVNEKFEHQSLGPIMRRCGLSSAGEIIAMGGVGPRQMVRMWLDSDGHRKILLSRSYRIAGVGAFLGDNGAWYGVVDFGRR